MLYRLGLVLDRVIFDAGSPVLKDELFTWFHVLPVGLAVTTPVYIKTSPVKSFSPASPFVASKMIVTGSVSRNGLGWVVTTCAWVVKTSSVSNRLVRRRNVCIERMERE